MLCDHGCCKKKKKNATKEGQCCTSGTIDNCMAMGEK